MHGQQACEKMLNIANYQGNANQTTIRQHITPVIIAITKKNTTNGDEGVGGNVNWHRMKVA